MGKREEALGRVTVVKPFEPTKGFGSDNSKQVPDDVFRLDEEIERQRKQRLVTYVNVVIGFACSITLIFQVWRRLIR